MPDSFGGVKTDRHTDRIALYILDGKCLWKEMFDDKNFDNL